MSALAKVLRSRVFRTMTGMSLLVGLIWLVLGSWLGLGATICLIATSGVLILFSLFLMWDQARATKNASNLEKSLWEQSEEQKSAVRPEKREEIENLRRQLSGSIEKLKTSKLGGGRKGTAALYALPWYMIIGPPAAGKSTAIRNSGLEFPFGTDREIQGVGGTRNCDWWFSNSAIILDTAGRYMTEEDDQEEWSAFLEVLKKNRRHQPINGVLVCISIADLVNATPEDVEWHAKTVRKRIDELTQRLGLRFPVYLIFTKCDLINGFVEFFEEFSRTEREQIWGCTLSKEQLDDPNPKAIFDREFQGLFDGLISARFARLSPGIKRESRSAIFAFPMEFLSARDNLSTFIQWVFQPNPYQESPIFRGFYFTSGTQEGVPIDRVIQSMAQAFGLEPQGKEQFSPEIQTKSYFIRDLFTNVIVPDQKLVRPSSRTARSKKIFNIGIAAASVAVLLLIILGVTQAYFRSKGVVESTGNDVTQFKSSSFDRSPSNSLSRLNALLARINTLQDPPFFLFGMDRSQRLLGPMRTLYFRQLRAYVQSNFLQPLQTRLSNPAGSRGEAYDDLKTYLLLTSETSRLRGDERNRKYLTQRLGKMIDPRESNVAMPHIDYFVAVFPEAVAEGIAQPFPADPRAVASVRNFAGKLDVPGIYENLKRKLETLPPCPIGGQAFTGAQEVRGLYTREGYKALDEFIKSGEFQVVGDEGKWVLALDGSRTEMAAANPSLVGDSLRGMYLREYAAEWWSALSSLHIVPFENLSDAANRLRTLGDARNSPLKRLFDDVVRNTTLQSSEQQAITDKVSGFADKAGLADKADKVNVSFAPANFVETEFIDVHRFSESEQGKGKPGDIDGLMALLSRAGDDLDAAATAPPKEAKARAADALSGTGSLAEALREIRRLSKNQDDRTRRVFVSLFEQPIHYGWKALIDRAMEYFNDEWHKQVFEPYHELSGFFPFDPNGQDAPLTEVAALFADNGKLDKFVSTELKPFVDEENGWDPKKWDGGEGIVLSPAARNALNQAKVLKLSLFRGADAGMKVELSLKSVVRPDGSPETDKVYVHVGSKEFCWKLEDKPPTFIFDWPGDGGAGFRLAEQGGKVLGLFGSADDKQVDEKSFDGGWGLFRLVSTSTITPGLGRSEVRCKWTFKQGIAVTGSIKTDKGFNNPLGRSLAVVLPDKLN
jgi:type VI secretion system protein ImpL